jgi:anti-anti-sigma factor
MRIHEAADVVTLTPCGALFDGESSDRLEAELDRVFGQDSPQVVIDLRGTSRLSARAIGIIACAHSKARRRNSRLVVRGVLPEHRWVLELTRLSWLVESAGAEASASPEQEASAMSRR